MSFKLYQRGEIWYIDSGPIPGGRIRKSTRTRNRQLAEHKRAAAEARYLRAEVYGKEREITFAEASLLYMNSGKEKRYLAPIINSFRETRLSDIKPGHIHDLADTLYPEGTPATKNRCVVTPAQAVINHAAERGLAHPIRVKRLKVVRNLKKARKAITPEWLAAYRAVTDPHDGALARFMYETAARISEAVALEPDDFDLPHRQAILSGAFTKNGEDRYFFLTEGMAAELMELPLKNDRVFGYHDRYQPLKVRRRVCNRNGLEYFGLHEGGRHSFATEFVVRQKIDVKTTAKIGGWKSTKVLIDNYVHPEGLDSVVEKAFAGTHESQSNIKILKHKGK